MRVKVTTEIDHSLRLMYDAVQDEHKPTIRGMIEQGMIAYLQAKDPKAALQAQIETAKRELNDLQEQLAGLRVLEPQQKRMQDRQHKQDDVEEQRRLDWWEQRKERLIPAVEEGHINWARITTSSPFTSPAKCKAWVLDVVASWKATHET